MTTTAIAPIAPFGEVLATDSSTAATSTARCCLCRKTVLHGERFALVIPSGLPAHLFCIGAAAQRPQRRLVIR